MAGKGEQGRLQRPCRHIDSRGLSAGRPFRYTLPGYRKKAPGPYLILWPFLVRWSDPPMSMDGARPFGESEHWSKREPRIPSGGTPPHSSPGSFTPAQPSHQSGGSRGQHGWNLSGASRNVAETSTRETKHHTQRVGELRFSRGVNTPSSKPRTRAIQSFYTQ